MALTERCERGIEKLEADRLKIACSSAGKGTSGEKVSSRTGGQGETSVLQKMGAASGFKVARRKQIRKKRL